jgi:hypothetical protein
MHDWNRVATDASLLFFAMRKVTARVPLVRERGERKDCQTPIQQSAHDTSAAFDMKSLVMLLRAVQGLQIGGTSASNEGLDP